MLNEGWGSPDEWRLAQRGDRAAAAALARRLLPRVRRSLHRLRRMPADELDDLTQEVFLRLTDGLARLRDPEKAAGFVLGIVTHVAREADRRRRPAHSLEDVPHHRPPASDAQERELRDATERAIAALTPALREVLVLSVYERRSPTDIAEILNLGAEAVRHRLFRARRQLHDALAPWTQLEPDSREIRP